MSKRDLNDILREEGPDAVRTAFDEAAARTPFRSNGAAHDDEPDPRPPAFSDEALALRFAERHERDLRYVAAWGRWIRYDGKRWAFDDTMLAFDLARRDLSRGRR